MNANEMLKLLENGSNEMGEYLPEAMEKFWAFAEKTKEEGALNKREKSLIALGAAVAKHCECCIVRNLQDAIEAGISKKELAELCNILMLLDGGPGFAHSAFLLEKYDELKADS